MSNKNDTFNIDDLLNMPNLANEFDKTSELFLNNNIEDEKIAINKTIKIDSLINDNNDQQDFYIRTTPPPPPPIINNKPIKEFDNKDKNNQFVELTSNYVDIKEEKIKNIEPNKFLSNQFEPSVTSAIDLDDFDFIEITNEVQTNEKIEEEINEINSKIDRVIEKSSVSEFYGNIKEQHETYEDQNLYSRVYFDEEIEKHIGNKTITQSQIDDKYTIPYVDSVNVQTMQQETKRKGISEKLKKFKPKKVKENLSSVPQFYKFEYKYAKIAWYVSISLMVSCILVISLGAYAVFGAGISTWLFMPIVLYIIGCFSYFIINTIKLNSMKKELKTNGYIITKDNIMTSITSVYKKLITSNYYLNWGSAGLYVVSGLLILMTFIVCYFINLANRDGPMPEFGELLIGNTRDNNAPLIVVCTFGSLCGLALIAQLIYNPLNVYRRNQIEVFYGQTLISEEMIEKYRKSANRKGIALFIVSTAVVSIIVLLVYFFMKRKSKKS